MYSCRCREEKMTKVEMGEEDESAREETEEAKQNTTNNADCAIRPTRAGGWSRLPNAAMSKVVEMVRALVTG